MRLARLALGAALLVGAAPLAAPSHARCAPDWAVVCSTLALACRTVENTTGVDPECPYY